MGRLAATVKAVVFDLDDTLYPEIEYVWSGFRVVAARLAGGDGDAGAVFDLLRAAFEQGPRDRVFDTVLEQLGREADEQIVAELVGVYRCHRPALRLEPAVAGLLGQLRSRYRLGIITDGYLPAQRLKVEALQLQDAFEKIIYTEELGREFWKPSVRSFEMMAEALGCAGGQCVYVADNPRKDFVAPNRLGWATVQVKRPERVVREVSIPSGGEAQFTIESVGELAMLLAE